MNPIKIRELIIGEGRPKICVPIVGKTVNDIRSAMHTVAGSCADMVEWRADWFDEVSDMEAVEMILKELRDSLGNMPILFTFRSIEEGGEKEISYEQYEELLVVVAQTRLADMIDVEVFMDDRTIDLMAKLREKGVIVVGSNHDFASTPKKEEIIRRLRKMQDMGADIPKIAAMPRSKSDVMTLLSATFEMADEYAEGPIVTMSMSELGVSSRMFGEFFGSAITFATAGQASAPGQMEAKELKEILDLLHRQRSEKKA